jgi:MinD-like ATPase involved in chromosome partitioning or flagellar assembly
MSKTTHQSTTPRTQVTSTSAPEATAAASSARGSTPRAPRTAPGVRSSARSQSSASTAQPAVAYPAPEARSRTTAAPLPASPSEPPHQASVEEPVSSDGAQEAPKIAALLQRRRGGTSAASRPEVAAEREGQPVGEPVEAAALAAAAASIAPVEEPATGATAETASSRPRVIDLTALDAAEGHASRTQLPLAPSARTEVPLPAEGQTTTYVFTAGAAEPSAQEGSAGSAVADAASLLVNEQLPESSIAATPDVDELPGELDSAEQDVTQDVAGQDLTASEDEPVEQLSDREVDDVPAGDPEPSRLTEQAPTAARAHERPRTSTRHLSTARTQPAAMTTPTPITAVTPPAHPEETSLVVAGELELEERFQAWQAAELDSAADHDSTLSAPQSGWRKAAVTLSAGLYNPGPSPLEVSAAQRAADLRTPLRGNRHVAVVSTVGGVGKTMTAGFLGQAWAESRGDRVCAIDANPDDGNLAERFSGGGAIAPDGSRLHGPSATVRDLLNDDAFAPVDSVADMSNYVTIAGRLHILPAPRPDEPILTGEEYRRAQAIADRFYNLTLIDTGTSVANEVHQAVIDMADDVVFVVGPSMDAARRVKTMMDGLVARGYADLVARGVVVIVTRTAAESSLARRRRGGGVDTDTLASYFARRVRRVVTIPYDRALSDGVKVDFQRLREEVREPYLDAAADIAARFNGGARGRAPIVSNGRVPRVTSAPAAPGTGARRWVGLSKRRRAATPAAAAPPSVFDEPTEEASPQLTSLPRYGAHRPAVRSAQPPLAVHRDDDTASA